MLRKFFGMLFILCCLLAIAVAMVDYPLPDGVHRTIKAQDAIVSNQPEAIQNRDILTTEFGAPRGSFNTVLEKIQALKVLMKDIRCLFGFTPVLIPSIMHDHYPFFGSLDTEAQEQVYFATGEAMVFESSAVGERKLPEGREQQLTEGRLNYLLQRYATAPTDFNNRNLLRFCLQPKTKAYCNDSLTAQIVARMADDTQNWLLLMSQYPIGATEQYYDYFIRAVYAPSNNAYFVATYQAHFAAWLTQIEIPIMAWTMATGSVAGNVLEVPYGHVARLCKVANPPSDCLVLANRLIADDQTLIETNLGYNFKRTYFEAIGDMESAAILQSEFDQQRAEYLNSARFRWPYFETDFYQNVMAENQTTGEAAFFSKADEKVGQLLMENPGLCTP